jgi:Tol biopolymer transport system component/DNA-binding winged helix-turn-helix (wHTH) protein
LQVLEALLERPGELITRADLRVRLWPDNTFVDFDHSLNVAVNRLREVLDDSAETPRFVETIPRRGYRFIAAVASQAFPPAEKPPEHEFVPAVFAPASAANGRGKLSSAGWIALLVLLGLGATTGSWFLASLGPGSHPSDRSGTDSFERPTSVGQGTFRVVPLSSSPGNEYDAAFSPDGREVAFAWTGANYENLDIYVKQVGDEASQRLTSQPDEDYSPAWSPDGRQIAYLEDHNPESFNLMVVSARAGPARPIATFAGVVIVPEGPSLPYLAWAPGGGGLVVVAPAAADEPPALFYVSLNTREKRQLTYPAKSSRGDGTPAFSPDGKTLAFVRRLGERAGDVYLLAVDAAVEPLGDPEKLVAAKRAAGSLVWGANGRELIYPSTEGGTGLWRVSTDGSAQPQRLAIGGPLDMDPTGWGELQIAFSAAARRLIYQRMNRNTDLWRLRLSAPRGGIVEKTLIGSSTSNESFPALSPDGKTIAFNSNRGGSNEVWTANVDGSDAAQITSFGGPAGGAAVWSPDGNRLALHLTAANGGDICIVEKSGGPLKCITTDTADDQFPSWSRDGQWIYFSSKRSGRSEIWKIPANGGSPIQLTRQGGVGPIESLDGKSIYYSSRPGYGSICKVSQEGSAQESEVVRDTLSYLKNFQVVRDGIYFVAKRKSKAASSLNFFRFADREIIRLVDVERRIVGLDVSADERVIVWSQDTESSSDLVLVENFQ